MDELTTMPGDKCILQPCGLRPFLSPKYDLKNHPNYKQTAEADKKRNAFDAAKLVTRRMATINPNEQYTVYEVDAEDTSDIAEDEDLFDYSDVDDPEAFA